MDLKTKIIASKFKNTSYFTNLEDYIKEKNLENKLDYEKLKYLYDNLYNGFSEFIKQNIYPVGEFLSAGYSFKECEDISNILEDATDRTVFFYQKREQGYKFNKLFVDLKFSFDTYDRLRRQGNDNMQALERVKYELEIVPLYLRNIIEQLRSGKYIYHTEIESYYEYLNTQMENLRKSFEENVNEDQELKKYFEEITQSNYKSIIVAGVILGGIDVRNLQRENDNLNGEMEEYPYNREQIKMIDSYKKFENTLEDLERYVELNYADDMEM